MAIPAPHLPTGPVAIDSGRAEIIRARSDPASVTLWINDAPSSALNLDDPLVLDFEYMQWMFAIAAEHFPTDGRLDVLHLGAAGCALPRALAAAWPNSRHLAIEIDAQLAELVRTWFDLPRAPRLRIRVGDARAAVEQAGAASRNLIVRDAFADGQTPDHLTTRQYLAQCRRVLRPGGLYLANCADAANLRLARREVATAVSVFPHVAIVAEIGHIKGRRFGNAIVIGGDESFTETAARLDHRLRNMPVPAQIMAGEEAKSWARGALAFDDDAV